MKIEQILRQLGFLDNESRVYRASLETGLASAQVIAKKAGIKRTTTYSILEKLVERGVMGKSVAKGVARFMVEPPQKLVAMVRDLQDQLTAALPELEAVYNAHEAKPKIVFHEGKEAIANVLEDTLRECPEEILEWNTDLYFEKFPKSHDYIDQRAELGIRARRMAGEGSVWHLKHKNYDQIEKSETLVIPKELFWPEIEVNIYGNKVAFLNYVDDMSLIIENKTIATAMRQVYELSWRGGKQIEIS